MAPISYVPYGNVGVAVNNISDFNAWTQSPTWYVTTNANVVNAFYTLPWPHISNQPLMTTEEILRWQGVEDDALTTPAEKDREVSDWDS